MLETSLIVRPLNSRKIKLLDAPPADLPQLLNSDYSCKRCFENRSCMLYAASETEKIDRTGVKKTHGELMSKFAGRLSHEDLAFFRKWDRLIDLEAHASVSSIATAWLQESEHREIHSGETVSNLTFVGVHQNTSGSRVLLRFKRSTPEVFGEEKKDSLAISKGSHVVVSTDGSSFADSQSDPQIEYMNTQRQRKKFRHHMNVVRGYLEVMDGDDILISGKLEDQDRIENIVRKYNQRSDSTNDCNLKFRIDKDNAAVGVGTLRQNLINLFTGDYSRGEKEEPSQIEIARQRLLPRLRKIIVEMKPPTFQRMDDIEMFSQKHSSPGCLPMMLRNEFRDLNEDQQNAVRKVCMLAPRISEPNAFDSHSLSGIDVTGLYNDTGPSRYREDVNSIVCGENARRPRKACFGHFVHQYGCRQCSHQALGQRCGEGRRFRSEQYCARGAAIFMS